MRRLDRALAALAWRFFPLFSLLSPSPFVQLLAEHLQYRLVGFPLLTASNVSNVSLVPRKQFRLNGPAEIGTNCRNPFKQRWIVKEKLYRYIF